VGCGGGKAPQWEEKSNAVRGEKNGRFSKNRAVAAPGEIVEKKKMAQVTPEKGMGKGENHDGGGGPFRLLNIVHRISLAKAQLGVERGKGDSQRRREDDLAVKSRPYTKKATTEG